MLLLVLQTALKRRPDEYTFEDHICNNITYSLNTPDGSKEIEYEMPLLKLQEMLIQKNTVESSVE